MKHLSKKTTLLIVLALVMITALAFSLSACDLVFKRPISPPPSITEPDVLPSNASLGNIATSAQTRITVNGGGNKGTVSFNSTAEGYYLVYVTADKLPAKNQQDKTKKKNNFTYSLINTTTNKNLVNKKSSYAACYSPKDTSDEFAGRTRCWVFYLSANTKYNIVTKNNDSSSDKFTVKVEKNSFSGATTYTLNLNNANAPDFLAYKDYKLKAGTTYYFKGKDNTNGHHYITIDSPYDKKCIVTKMSSCEAVGSLRYLNYYSEEKSYIGSGEHTFTSYRYTQKANMDSISPADKNNYKNVLDGSATYEYTSDIRVLPLEDMTVTVKFGRYQEATIWNNKILTWKASSGPVTEGSTDIMYDYILYLPKSDVKILNGMYNKGNLIHKLELSKNIMSQSFDKLKERLKKDLIDSLTAFNNNADYFKSAKTFIIGFIGELLKTGIKHAISYALVLDAARNIETAVKNAADANTGLQISFKHSGLLVFVDTEKINNRTPIVFAPYLYRGNWVQYYNCVNTKINSI